MGIKIKDIPITDRPIERLIRCGAESLSDSELIAIIIKTGTFGISSKEVASILLSEIGGIKNLSTTNFETLKKVKGIGETKACNLLASIELGRRINKNIIDLKKIKLNSSTLVYEYYKEKLKDKKQECFYCVYLDNNKKIIKDKLLFMGTINYSMVHPREVFMEAYLSGATSIICIHNHPSGNVLPSKQDFEVTTNLIHASKILGIEVVDHLIIGKNNYYSFRENDDIHF